jgi:4-hydroxyacetophenone monooxygenase
MQLVPAVAEEVESLTIFQRSPQWAAPFEVFQREVPEELRWLSLEVPIYRAWYRLRAGWTFNDRLHDSLQKDPEWPHPERAVSAANDGHRRFFIRHIESELGDRTDLLDKVVPDYPPYGKRILLDNGWYRTLTRDNVTLVDDSIESVDADGVPGFPNFFIVYGPNTQAGHGGSLIGFAESQLNLILKLLDHMIEQDIGSVEVKRSAYDDFNETVDRAHEKMVWTHPGMDTYYRNSRGRVVVNTPFRVVDVWRMTREAKLEDFVTEPAYAGSRRIASIRSSASGIVADSRFLE